MTAPTRVPTPPPAPTGSGLSKQYGPLPLGAWIIVIGGALGIAYYTRNFGQPKQIAEDTSGVPGVGTGAASMWIQTAAPPTSVADDKFETNDEWARVGINYLVAQGYDAALADTAVRKYLESKALSLSELSMIRLVLAKYGSPPIPLPNAPELPTPPTGGGGSDVEDEFEKKFWWEKWWKEFQEKYPPPQAPPPIQQPPPPPPPPAPPKPTSTRWVTVTPWPTKTSTLWGIASVVYGSGAKWPTLYNANRVGVTRPDGSKGMIKDPNLIYAGWRIYCP